MTPVLNPHAWIDFLKPMPTGRGMVIVTGMPKSGTTAIAKLLGAATRETVCSDPFHTLTRMEISFRQELFEGQLSLRSLWQRHRHVFSGRIIKDPNFILLLPQIQELLPGAKLLFIVRDPRDNIRSILNRLGLPGAPRGVDLNSIGSSHAGWYNLLIGQLPGVPGNDYIEVLAWRWRKAAEVFLQHKNELVDIRYEDFLKNKSAAIFRLAGQLGFSGFSDIEHLVDVQYQPKGDSVISWEEFFGKAQLEVIDRVTGPVLEKFGYAITRGA